MNAVTTTEPVSSQTLEHVLGTGDLSKLSTQQRVEYYAKTCESLGLNPLTRPMRFLALNGQIQLYFTRDGTDQLRKAQGITLHVVDKLIEAGLFTVTVRARAKDGREDEDIGAVVLPQSGESRANALMKAMTKAKRRVTLSICGLGQTDESELDTMPGARVFDAEDDLPVAPIRAAAAPMPRGARVAERAPAYEAPPKPHSMMPNGPVDPNPVDVFKPERTDTQWRTFLDKMRDACAVLYHRSEVVQVAERPSVADALATGPAWVRDEVSAILAENYRRFGAEEPEAELPDVEINGAEKVMSG